MTARSSWVSMRVAPVVTTISQWLRERGLFYYRRARVVRCDVLEPDGEEPQVEAEVHPATDQELHQLAAMQSRTTADWLAKRGQGAFCLVARSGPALLGYLWITRSAELMTEVNRALDVSRDAAGAYLFDGYVLPAHRRKGVLRTLLNASKQWAKQQGLARLYAAFARENQASEHALRKVGFVTIVGDVGILRVLGREWKWIRFPHGMPTFDVLNARSESRPVPMPASAPRVP